MRQFTAIIERDEDWYVSLCPELDIVSQGRSVEEARRNLIEAIELFFEAASPSQIQERIHSHPLVSTRVRSEVFVTQVGVPVAWAAETICRTASPIETHPPFPQETWYNSCDVGRSPALCAGRFWRPPAAFPQPDIRSCRSRPLPPNSHLCRSISSSEHP